MTTPSLQWQYGKLRSSQSWVLWVSVLTGLLSFPAAWFLRDSIALGRAPLPAWTVLLVGGLLAVAGLFATAAIIKGGSGPAKLITIQNGMFTLPGSMLSGAGWSCRLEEVSVRTTELGFVKQMHLSGPRKRATLSSALFENDDEFDRLVSALHHSPQ